MPLYSFFFLQAEDGIRDYKVTGVQTCALPIFALADRHGRDAPWAFNRKEAKDHGEGGNIVGTPLRSEERRVGKEGRPRRWPEWGNKGGQRTAEDSRKLTRGGGQAPTATGRRAL